MIRFETDNDFQQGAFILLNKPYKWTSFDLVNKVKFKVKHKLRVKKIKVGHAGTLDPLATGLMIVCIGKYTKKIDTYQSQVKEYIATLQLGASTPSFDLETEIDQEYPTEHITRELVDETLKGFIGSIEQRPPDYSAVKVNGKRAYEYARKGQEVEIKKKTLVIDEIEVLEFAKNVLKIRVVCSKGTYIRALARDIGQALNSGAHLTALQRTQIGDFKIDDAIEIEDFIKFLENL
ncbi:tRNA pseudouridine(55) synthase TruB [Marinifilum sp. D714]|uniref:tRNA pseudouridine(55) synthase TruB n=1 Tax=Marinifilum sp. D714 TaxID=2937523 RepID=UPI0027C8D70C|nr:tRNA pseudouridine(55) synthase TruB [Marinifilum sp. D714]MDQ2180526.1 tRNA pseudouridine(55) synthase TruB [Marinifilum sp. D714]